MAKRRANGEGNIRKRADGRWEGRYTVGHDPVTGKQIFKNVLGKSQAEVKEKLSAAIQETAGLDILKAEQYTVETWLQFWLDNFGKMTMRPSTFESYSGNLRIHIKPHIGDIKLTKLRTSDLQKFYSKLLTEGQIVLERMNLSEKENSIAIYCPEIKKYWDYERNGKITPEQIPHANFKKVFLKCDLGHKWEVAVSNFSSHPWCPYCSGRKTLFGFNDLFTTNPELIPYWSKNNKIDPSKIKSGCNSKALWYCPKCGGEYEMKVNEKVKNPGCPYCSGHRVLKGFNDLATLVPDLIRDWDYEKNNPLTPNEVTKGSNKKVWWKCHSCKYEWRMVIYDRGTLGKGCPKCKKANLINPNSKCVIQLALDGNVIAEYKSVKEAVKQTGIKTIDKVCRKERKTAGGYIWKYKD